LGLLGVSTPDVVVFGEFSKSLKTGRMGEKVRRFDSFATHQPGAGGPRSTSWQERQDPGEAIWQEM
jgi:hypothetical protein